MILKRTYSPLKVFPYARAEVALGAAAGALALLVVPGAGAGWLALPPTLAVVLGTALSILLAFRANAAYQRWWDASGLWAQITGASRSFARIVVTLGDARKAAPQADAITAWQRRMVRRQIAWANALRLELRRQGAWESLGVYLDPDELAYALGAEARAVLLLRNHSREVFAAYGAGFLAGFDNFQLEQLLPQLAQQQALAERIKSTPIPRSYAIFARAFVHLYVVVFPFTIVGVLGPYPWMTHLLAALVGAVFGLVERTGAVSEEPFENTIQDVPLTAICTTIERDLLETLGEPERPPVAQPVDGYLW